MAESAALGAPVKVSPLIRFSRYALLIGGVLYGTSRYAYLKKKEDDHRAYVTKMTPTWTAQREAARAERNKKEMEELEKQTGVRL